MSIHQEAPQFENINDKYMIFKLENRDDIDIKLIYTPIFFHHLGLTAFISYKNNFQNEMTGGYSQPIENLTVPFRYFVYLVDKNPLTLAIQNFKFESKHQEQPIVSGETSKQNGIFSITKNFNSDKKNIQSTPIQHVTQELPHKEPINIFDFSAFTDLFAPKKESLEQPITEPIQELIPEQTPTLEENEQSVKEQLIIKIEKNEIIEEPLLYDNLNGKSLKDILNEYKNKPKTIEDFQVSGINYNILERIVVDIFSQLELLLNELNIVFTEINEDFIYNINEKHVLLDSYHLKYIGNDLTKIEEERTNNKIILNNLVKRITGNERFENTKVFNLLNR